VSQITIDARDARLAVLGYQPEVKRIYWSALPNKLPTYGQTLDLSGCEIKAIYADGSEAVVTDYCTFSPDTGYTVPNAKTLTVTATYTARSGKAYEADETLPICIPAYIKIIVPRTVPIVKEGSYLGDNSWSSFSSFFRLRDLYVCLFWERDGEVVAITKVPASLSQTTGCYYSSSYAGVSHNLSSATYTRYYTPTETEEVTADYAFQVKASYTLYGLTFTDTANIEADIVDGLRIINVPTTYNETFTQEFTASNIRLLYKSGAVMKAEDITTRSGIVGFYRTGINPGYYYTTSMTFGDNENGTRKLSFETNPVRLQNDISYECADNAITWTNAL